MKFQEQEIVSADGIRITIREATLNDAAAILKCINTYITDSTYMVVEPEEFTLSLVQGREWIHAFNEEPNSLLIIAEHEGAVIGNLDITGAKRSRLQHNGLIGMGMLKEWRGKGLGKSLLHAGIDWAAKNQYLQRLWLQVIANNQPAISLYKKMGFVQEGLQKDFIRINGSYYDNLIMGLPLTS